MLAVSLARLEFRPPEPWLASFSDAAAARMSSFGAQVRSSFGGSAACMLHACCVALVAVSSTSCHWHSFQLVFSPWLNG